MVVTKCCEEGLRRIDRTSPRVTIETTIDEAKVIRCSGCGRERNRRLVQARTGLVGRNLRRQ